MEWNARIQHFSQTGYKAPFIFVTGAIGEEKVAECLREGVSDFVFKHHLASCPRLLTDRLENTNFATNANARLRLYAKVSKIPGFSGISCFGILIYQGAECCYANRKAEEITGYTRIELALVRSWEIIHPILETCRLSSVWPNFRTTNLPNDSN